MDLDDRATLRERAAACLAEMQEQGSRCGTSAWRMRVGETVGRALARDEDMRDEARQALEIAAVAALERSWEAKQFFQGFPQLERMDPADIALLEAHGARFRAKHLELLAGMRSLLREGAHLEAALACHGVDEFFVAVCAWCHRVRGPERVWISLDEYTAPSRDLDVTHGVCETCTVGLVAGRRDAARTQHVASEDCA